MNSKILVVGLVCLSLAAGGCSRALSRQVSSAVGEVYAEKTQADATETLKTFVTENNTAQIVAPGTWYDASSESDQPDMVLHINSRADEIQIGVQTFSKADYPYMTPELASTAVAEAAKAATGGESAVVEQTALSEINGLPAIQYEARGEFMGQEVIALTTSVESPSDYYQILVIGTASDFDQNRSELDQIIQSFREVPAAAAQQP